MKSNPDSPIISISPRHYIHVLNLNTHVTSLVVGPKTYVCQQDEKIVLGPEELTVVPTMMYCVIRNPVITDKDGVPVVDKYGQVKVRMGDEEYRFAQDPFPLYPGEALKDIVRPLPVVLPNSALRLRAVSDFEDGNVNRIAGEEWLFEGPGTYYPRKEVEIIKCEQAKVILVNSALVMEATKDCVDRGGVPRVYGERWLVTTPGAYLPGVYEQIVDERKAITLTDRRAICVKAVKSHCDKFGKYRKAGEEWLITHEDAEYHICSALEEFVKEVDVTILRVHQFCVVVNPWDENGVPQLGRKLLVRGEKSFFLRPGEYLETGVQDAYILQNDEGLILRAKEQFVDDICGDAISEGDSVKQKCIRRPGDRWMLRGPIEYIPPVEVDVIGRRNVIPLDCNEGIYVRNMQTGQVRAVIGEAYMLNQDEELWEKKLPPEVVQLLESNIDPFADRGVRSSPDSVNRLDPTRVVTFRVPHNAAVQIYDYKNKRARVEFGPNLAMLGPDEQFTRLSLSGGKPKKPNVIKSLCLLLGPDFCTDVVIVETADHARLSLQLSYNWVFDVSPSCSAADAAKLFSVPDFVGDACKAIASRVRGTVASVQFDDFHKHSSRIIRASVFGLDEAGKVRDRIVFPQNNLHITSVDVQSVEPVDQRTRDSLQKSVQLAIEITTNSQEAAARHEAERLEQEARGRLERQRIEDEAAAEQARRNLLEIRVQLAALESSSQAKAEAESRAEANRISSQAAVEEAKLRAEALSIETNAELERLKLARAAEIAYIKEKNELALKYKEDETEIEKSRFISMVNALGADTLRAMATAESDHNLSMLNALGLQSTLITDGTTPVNLLTTAHGLIGSVFKGSSRKRTSEVLDDVDEK
ncbi:unnamed protein product [Schistosoma guineensis]|nr:unnamed protein product [Schistosoma guineensis]